MSDQVAISPKAVKVKLDVERTICYNKRAEYRMGTLDKPFDVHDLKKPRRSYAALVAWVWACLNDRDALTFPTPESLAMHIHERNVSDVFVAFVETWASGQEVDPGDATKNG